MILKESHQSGSNKRDLNFNLCFDRLFLVGRYLMTTNKFTLAIYKKKYETCLHGCSYIKVCFVMRWHPECGYYFVSMLFFTFDLYIFTSQSV